MLSTQAAGTAAQATNDPTKAAVFRWVSGHPEISVIVAAGILLIAALTFIYTVRRNREPDAVAKWRNLFDGEEKSHEKTKIALAKQCEEEKTVLSKGHEREKAAALLLMDGYAAQLKAQQVELKELRDRVARLQTVVRAATVVAGDIAKSVDQRVQEIVALPVELLSSKLLPRVLGTSSEPQEGLDAEDKELAHSVELLLREARQTQAAVMAISHLPVYLMDATDIESEEQRYAEWAKACAATGYTPPDTFGLLANRAAHEFKDPKKARTSS